MCNHASVEDNSLLVDGVPLKVGYEHNAICNKEHIVLCNQDGIIKTRLNTDIQLLISKEFNCNNEKQNLSVKAMHNKTCNMESSLIICSNKIKFMLIDFASGFDDLLQKCIDVVIPFRKVIAENVDFHISPSIIQEEKADADLVKCHKQKSRIYMKTENSKNSVNLLDSYYKNSDFSNLTSVNFLYDNLVNNITLDDDIWTCEEKAINNKEGIVHLNLENQTENEGFLVYNYDDSEEFECQNNDLCESKSKRTIKNEDDIFGHQREIKPKLGKIMLAVPIKYDVLNRDISNSSDFSTYKLIKIQDQDVITSQSFINQLIKSNIKTQLALGSDYSTALSKVNVDKSMQINITDSKLEVFESKAEVDIQTTDKATSSIINNYEEHSNTDGKRLSYYDIEDICKGNEACLRDMKMIERLRSFESILEWIYNNANLVALINILVACIILFFIFRGSLLSKEDSLVIVQENEAHIKNNLEHSIENIKVLNTISDTNLKQTNIIEGIPNFCLDRSDFLSECDFDLKRKISNSSVGGISVNSFRKDTNIQENNKLSLFPHEQMTNNILTISKSNPFSNQGSKRIIINDNTNSPIIEEKSRNCSPDSFEKLKRDYAKNEVQKSDQEYIMTNSGILEIQNKRKFTYYEDHPKLNKIISDHINTQNKNIYIQSNLKPNKYKSLGEHNLDFNPRIESNFEDQNFLDFAKNLNTSKRTENHYLRSKRSKTFKEDDPEYLVGSNEGKGNKSYRHKLSTAYLSRKKSRLTKSKGTDSRNEESINNKEQQIQANQVVSYAKGAIANRTIGRITKYTKIDYKTNLREESKFVQNESDIDFENKNSINMNKNYVNNDIMKHLSQPNTILEYGTIDFRENELKKSSFYSDNEKVKELSCIFGDTIINDEEQSKSQINNIVINSGHSNKSNAHQQSTNLMKDMIRLDNNQISCDMPDEQERIAREIEISKSSVSRVPGFNYPNNDFNEDSCSCDNNFSSTNTNIDKYITKESSLYKHLLFSHSNSFKYIGPIGKGGFGSVMKAKHILDNNIYAIKKIKLHLGKDQDIKKHKVFREVQMMTIVNHVNVIRYFTCWLELADDQEQIKEQKRITKRYGKFSKQTFATSTIKERKSTVKALKRESSSDSPYFNRSQSGPSINDKSDSSIVFEKGECTNSKFICEEENDSESIEFVNNNANSMFDEESKVNQEKYKEESNLQSNEELSSDSSNSLDSILDYTNCFDLLENKKQFITVNLKIQMEICSGQSLKDFLDKRHSNKEEINRKVNFKIFKQIVEGIKHVHKQGIIHRDLKPANVFFTGDGIIKIGDFGLARAIDEEALKSRANLANAISSHLASENKKKYAKGFKDKNGFSLKVGTPLYLSPEQAEGVFYDEKVDIYAIGLILFELCYAISTYHEKQLCFQNILKQDLPSIVESKMKNEASLIKALTRLDPNKRPSARGISKMEEYKLWKKEMNNEDDE